MSLSVGCHWRLARQCPGATNPRPPQALEKNGSSGKHRTMRQRQRLKRSPEGATGCRSAAQPVDDAPIKRPAPQGQRRHARLHCLRPCRGGVRSRCSPPRVSLRSTRGHNPSPLQGDPGWTKKKARPSKARAEPFRGQNLAGRFRPCETSPTIVHSRRLVNRFPSLSRQIAKRNDHIFIMPPPPASAGGCRSRTSKASRPASPG